MYLTSGRTAQYIFVGLLLTALPPNRLHAQSLPMPVNPTSATYDYYPSSTTAADGSMWLAWHGYERSRDQILARRVTKANELGAVQTISQNGSVHGPPTIISNDAATVSIVWSTKSATRWRIMLRQYRDGKWHDAITLSNLEHDAIFPHAVAMPDNRLVVAWSENAGARTQIRACIVDAGKPSAPTSISSDQVDAYRPQLVVDGDSVHVFWDQCRETNYSVCSRRILPTMEDPEHLSPPEENCLTPTALSHADGIYVAWLRKVDVIGGPGVISQMHTLHAMHHNGKAWVPIETPTGDTTAAELTHGLMAQIEPKPVATGGYLGPRTRPMWLADEGRVWLLWERKSDHRGSTPKVSGHLVGRPVVDGKWSESKILARERIDYHVIDPPVTRSGKIRLLASRMPHHRLRRYETFDVDLAEAEPFQQDAWTGWKPIELPIEKEKAPRRSIQAANGKTYQLFWGDFHCHNGLTADAEGEPDEQHIYARDRAELDVVAFTNNDFYNVPLTQYEFELGNLFAKIFSAKRETGRRTMLSLPGYEWTSRIPGVRDASVSDSSNWLPPYRNRSYPNHRSVIYPPAGGPLVHFTEVENDIAKLNDAVQKAGGITLSQHSAFKLSGHPVEVGMELTSGWSNYIASHPKLFHDPLNKGARLGFTANGDTHRRAPGLSGALTGIYAESLTAESVIDALRERRCYATMGAKIFLDSRANDALMGRDVKAKGDRVTLTLHAIGTRPITRAVLIRDGKEIHRVEGGESLETRTSFTDDDLSAGTHWYYWRVSQQQTAPVLPGNLMPAHGHLAWSTPHWVIVSDENK